MHKTLVFLLIIVSFFAFFRLGDHPIQDWDEARHGINAIEMLQNRDWVNLHFKGQPDDWNVKPPLTIWAIATSYSIFGVNEWALRIPSALAIILAFFFLCKIIRLYRPEEFAFFTCLILVSVKGWIGYHVGRTGDTDAMLVAFLMGGTFFFLKLLETKKNANILLSALFFGLAFLTKGFAMMIFVPSILLFSFFTQELRFLFSKKATYLALLLFLLFPLGWLWVNTQYGISFSENSEIKNNAFTSMILYDLVERFSNPNFIDPASPPTKLFFFTYLDTRFNVWNYFFLFGFFAVLISFLRKKNKCESDFFKNKITFDFDGNLLDNTALFISKFCEYSASLVFGTCTSFCCNFNLRNDFLVKRTILFFQIFIFWSFGFYLNSTSSYV